MYPASCYKLHRQVQYNLSLGELVADRISRSMSRARPTHPMALRRISFCTSPDAAPAVDLTTKVRVRLAQTLASRARMIPAFAVSQAGARLAREAKIRRRSAASL